MRNKKKKSYDEDTIIVKDKIYIPEKHISPSLANKYIHRLYTDKDCVYCENRPNRHNELCDSCPAYTGTISTMNNVSVGGIDYYGLPLGEKSKIPKKFGIDFRDFNVVDLRTEEPFEYNIKMKKRFELRDYQVPATSKMIKKKHGVLISPPRSGKCVIGGTNIQLQKGVVSFHSVFKNLPNPKKGEVQKIKNRDKIMTSEGFKNVVEYTRQWVEETCAIKTHENFYLRGTLDHPVLTLDRSDATLQWKNLNDIEVNDYICMAVGRESDTRKNFKIKDNTRISIELCRVFAILMKFSRNIDPNAKDWVYTMPMYEAGLFDSLYKKIFPKARVKIENKEYYKKITIYDENEIKYLREFGFSAVQNKIPYSIVISKTIYMRAFLEQLFKLHDNVLFTSSNLNLVKHIQTILVHLGVVTKTIKAKLYNDEVSFSIAPLNGDTTAEVKKLKPTELSIPEDIEVDEEQRNFLLSKNFFFAKVTFKDTQKEPVLVYDVTVDRHHYLSSGIVSHNTPMMLNTAVRIGNRTLVLAKQTDWLDQFLYHIEDFTNLPFLERKYNKKLFGYLKTKQDYYTYQIGLSTYHQFIAKPLGKKRLAAAKENFGTVLVDEVHTANSLGFAKVLSSLPSKVKIGVSANNTRKDNRHFLVEEIIGPVQHRVSIPELTPSIIIEDCDFVKTKSKYTGKAGYVFCCKFLSKHKKRNELILKRIGEDLKAGHSIVIPTLFREHTLDLVNEINDMYASTYGHYSNISKEEKKVAAAFLGGAKDKEKREDILNACREGRIKVIVGTRSLLQLGLNVIPWSSLFYILPASNKENWKQESSRICTPDPEGKKGSPVIRMFVDKYVDLALGCWANTYGHSMFYKHKIDPDNKRKADQILKLKADRRSENKKEDIYATSQIKRKGLFTKKFDPSEPYA